MQNTFRKHERLSSKKLIQELFAKSSSFYLYPFVVKFKTDTKGNKHHSVLINVSKRSFKKAVDRNLIKRRIREAYRLNKSALGTLLDEDKALNIALLYSAKEELAFDLIEKKLNLVLERLVKENNS